MGNLWAFGQVDGYFDGFVDGLVDDLVDGLVDGWLFDGRPRQGARTEKVLRKGYLMVT